MGVITDTPRPIRALARPASVIGTALDIVLADPLLWLLGSAAFLLRGGIVLLLLPVIALPTPVEIRLLVGSGIGSTGPSSGLVVSIFVFAVAATVGLMLILYVVSWLEVWSYERMSRDRLLTASQSRRAASRVFSVQAATLSALALASVPILLGAINVAYTELVRPTCEGALYDCIVAGVQGQLVLLAAAVLLIETLSAVFTRRALGRSYGIAWPSAGVGRWRPVIAVVGWLVTLAVLAPSLWALAVSWRAVSQGLARGASTDPLAVVPQIVVLAVVWAAAVVLAGFASALRGALWTVQEQV